jgi:hypothetical protein
MRCNGTQKPFSPKRLTVSCHYNYVPILASTLAEHLHVLLLQFTVIWETVQEVLQQQIMVKISSATLTVLSSDLYQVMRHVDTLMSNPRLKYVQVVSGLV